MPTFTTSIKLYSATETDYQKLSQELQKSHFSPATVPHAPKGKAVKPSHLFRCTSRNSLLEATTAVSHAASMTGKKYSFTVMKEKPKTE